MAKRFKLDVGDVFSIPLNNSEIGFGQCINQYDKRSGGFVIAVYNYRQSKDSDNDLSEIVSSIPLFLGFTFDAKLFHKDWLVLGNCISNLDQIKLPYNRLSSQSDTMYLLDVNNKCISEISEDIYNELNHRTEIAPIRFENALKAYFGLQEWNEEEYDKLLYKHALKSNEIAENFLM